MATAASIHPTALVDPRAELGPGVSIGAFAVIGGEVTVEAGEAGIRFLLVSGKPLQEPVAWYGPIVMNSQAELKEALRELQVGTFIKKV